MPDNNQAVSGGDARRSQIGAVGVSGKEATVEIAGSIYRRRGISISFEPPFGGRGDLTSDPDCTTELVSRDLKQSIYQGRPRGAAPLFGVVGTCDELHRFFIAAKLRRRRVKHDLGLTCRKGTCVCVEFGRAAYRRRVAF